MVTTFAELAADPKGPSVSKVLEDAAAYTGEGPFGALLHGAYGSSNYYVYAITASLEQSIAYGYAILSVGRMLDPAISPEYPRVEWEAERLLGMVGRAHQALMAWADEHSPDELSTLFRAVSAEVKLEEN
ncbi:hypothetical protein [Streptomyces sp. CAU 1734]|uniref:hypothetical protein n=1 Tax=Streptomyces sp. CAU 1734 TaxID=3140360 RepID=UPI003261C5A1